MWYKRDSFWVALAGSVPFGFAVGHGIFLGDWSDVTEGTVGALIVVWSTFFIGKGISPQQINVHRKVPKHVADLARDLLKEEEAKHP